MATFSLNIKGPPGNKGATGDTGITGDTGPAGPTSVSANSGNLVKLGSDSKLWTPSSPAINLADPTQNGYLATVSGLTTDYVDGVNACTDLVLPTKQQVWNIRSRSYNAIGNPNMEVQNRFGVFSTNSNAGGAAWPADRWQVWTAGGLNARTASGNGGSVLVYVPNADGSDTYPVGGSYIYVQSQSAQTTLAAGDGCTIYQSVEGSIARELMDDVTSLTIVATASVAPFSFCVALRDAANTYSWCHTCTITQTATWTVFQIPNIPRFTSSGTFNNIAGQLGYSILLSPAMGSTWVAPQNDVWVSGNYYGTSNQSNLFSAINQSFAVAYVQHEPGPVCTAPIDIQFDENLRACLRHYQKSCAYPTLCPTQMGGVYKQHGIWITTTAIRMLVDFPVRMAVAPTFIAYGFNSATPHQAYIDNSGATNYALTSGGYGVYDSGVQTATTVTSFTGSQPCATLGNWEAHTGW